MPLMPLLGVIAMATIFLGNYVMVCYTCRPLEHNWNQPRHNTFFMTLTAVTLAVLICLGAIVRCVVTELPFYIESSICISSPGHRCRNLFMKSKSLANYLFYYLNLFIIIVVFTKLHNQFCSTCSLLNADTVLLFPAFIPSNITFFQSTILLNVAKKFAQPVL